jgi:hypothetical protein
MEGEKKRRRKFDREYTGGICRGRKKSIKKMLRVHSQGWGS